MLFVRSTLVRSSPSLLCRRAAVLPSFSPSSRLWRAATMTRLASTLPRLPVFEAIAAHDPTSTAVIHSLSGRRFSYGELLHDVAAAKEKLLAEAGQPLDGERIAFLVENGYDYVVTWLAILGARAIALPLSPSFPAQELQYIMNQSQALMLLSSTKFAAKAKDVFQTDLEASPKHVMVEKKLGGAPYEQVTLEGVADGAGGMMLYTSGTTNRPSVMTAQALSLKQAWEYSTHDHLLHVLPLHHIHGTINAIFAPLFAGSTVEFMFPFNPTAVWNRFAAPFLPGSTTSEKITFFTVVPTVYNRLLSTHTDLAPDAQAATKQAITPDNLRLCISGSAALPTPIKKAWQDLSSGNVLLERYGMTEVGMALSCGLDFADRVDASVGWPLPSVEARLVDVDTGAVIDAGAETDANGKERDGEIQLRGPTIFQEYFRNPAATASEFVDGGDGGAKWFKTGDIAVRRPVPAAGHSAAASQAGWARGAMYFIHGRKSADIIKSGGEKVSALEVERELLSLPAIAECAVVAVPSGRWGHKVGAVVVLAPAEQARAAQPGAKPFGVMDLRRALRDRLVNYKIPQVLKLVDSIPRNAMGKINKKQLVKSVFTEEMSGDEM